MLESSGIGLPGLGLQRINQPANNPFLLSRLFDGELGYPQHLAFNQPLAVLPQNRFIRGATGNAIIQIDDRQSHLGGLLAHCAFRNAAKQAPAFAERDKLFARGAHFGGRAYSGVEGLSLYKHGLLRKIDRENMRMFAVVELIAIIGAIERAVHIRDKRKSRSRSGTSITMAKNRRFNGFRLHNFTWLKIDDWQSLIARLSGLPNANTDHGTHPCKTGIDHSGQPFGSRAPAALDAPGREAAFGKTRDGPRGKVCGSVIGSYSCSLTGSFFGFR